MPARHTIDYVKSYVKERTNGECEVISDEYINSNSILEIKCGCGNIFTRKFKKIKNGDIRCIECGNKKRSEMYRFDIEYVIDDINSTGCEYISGEYKNLYSKLKIRCRCGNIFEKSYGKFIKGQQQCPDCGKIINVEKRTKYTADYVQQTVNSERGYNIDKDKYIVSYKPVPCTCDKGHKFNLTFAWYVSEGAGCPECARLKRIGENNSVWKGGVSEVIERIRQDIMFWRIDVLKSYNYKCAITDENNKDLKIHHIYALSNILEDVSKDLCIPLYRKIKDYDNIDDYFRLKDEVIKRHVVTNGLPLRESIHKHFHNLYGYGYNTPEQFNEFLVNYYNTTLKEIQLKQIIYTPDKETA